MNADEVTPVASASRRSTLRGVGKQAIAAVALLFAPLPATADLKLATPEVYSSSAALVIGVSKYRSSWSELPNTVVDALRVADALSNDKHGFEIRLLIDRAPSADIVPVNPAWDLRHVPTLTAANLREEIRDFLITRGAEASARLLIWFAGHGTTVDGEGFLVGANAPSANDPAFPLHALQMRDVGNWVRLARSRHVLVIFDSCFGATIFEPRMHPRPYDAPHDMFNQPVRQFITSGGPNETVPDESVFRASFLTAIKGLDSSANPDGDEWLTASELGLYLGIRVQRETKGAQTPQYGELLDRRFERGNFAFHWAAAEPATPATPNAQSWVPVPFKDCDNCPELIPLTPGRIIGTDTTIETGFAIGAYEVTFDEWDRCFEEGGCNHKQDAGWGRGRRPVVYVNLDEAQQYLSWLTRKTGQTYRLPTEAEWEYAARGGTGSAYWFGDRMESGRANCRGCNPMQTGTLEVGSFGVEGANAFGVHDVHGNVWEWTCAADGLGSCAKAAVRGGSWANNQRLARADSRAEIPTEARSVGVGFRVVRETRSMRAGE